MLRRRGRSATLVIEIAPDLDVRARRRARADGPPHAATCSTYPSLLRSAGFVDVEVIDLTSEYFETVAAWRRERARREVAYRMAVGAEAAADGLERGTVALQAIEAGLLLRTLYVARRP